MSGYVHISPTLEFERYLLTTVVWSRRDPLNQTELWPTWTQHVPMPVLPWHAKFAHTTALHSRKPHCCNSHIRVYVITQDLNGSPGTRLLRDSVVISTRLAQRPAPLMHSAYYFKPIHTVCTIQL